MPSPAQKLRRAQSLTMPEDDLRARSEALPPPGSAMDPAIRAELARIRIASERHHSFQFWRRVVPLFLLLGGLPLIIVIVLMLLTPGGDTLSDKELAAIRQQTAQPAGR